MLLMRWPVVLVLSTIALINEISRWIVNYLLFSQTRGRTAALLLQAHDLSLQYVDRIPDQSSRSKIRFAAGISIQVMHELVRRHESLFPQKSVPMYGAGQMKTAFRRQRHGASHKLLRQVVCQENRGFQG
jgi:hypothetical protein